MITCAIMGGLGNQLFEIFATIAYAFKYKDTVVFPYSPYADARRATYWDVFLSSLKPFTTLNPKYNITNEQLNISHTIQWTQHHYEPLPQFPKMQINRLFGCLQSYKYFEEYKDTLFRMIRLSEMQNQIRTQYSNYLQEKTVSMHFRYGDYKHLQNYHNILPYEYYLNSLKHISTMYGDISFRVLYFCEREDNEIIAQIINKLRSQYPRIEFMKADDTIEDWKQMLIMSCCDSHIIANSTFSWWGAYFNTNEEKHVCYPSKWFGPMNAHHRIEDMFMPSWTKINVE